jgi:glycosyltransferase involved in cell wall biosynthesis
MRVAIDARELLGQPTGVGRYLAGILNEWETMPEAASHEFVLCAPKCIDAAFLRNARVSTVVADGRGTWWEQTVLPRLVSRTGADVLFAPGYTSPVFCSVPSVVAIHDVSFAAHPEWFSLREGIRRRMFTTICARRAAVVLTISEFSKREITSWLGVMPEKVDVVYPGIAPIAGGSVTEGPRLPHTVLYVGSLFTRRHIAELVVGFSALAQRRTDVQLEIVGDNRTTPRVDLERMVTAAGSGDRIRLRSFVPDAELRTLYRSARAFVFLSSYEGFGLTPLEALAAGVPIVVLDTPVAREVYADAALYVERPEPPLIAAALERILTDEAERSRILVAGRSVLDRYSWRRCSEQVLDLLGRASTCRASR